jgi:hypothetical protein
VARSLTRAEAVSAGSLLSSPNVSTRERIRSSGLAPRTYEVARQRGLDSGWLIDRFVPDPRVAGRRHAVFAFGRPFVENRMSQSRAWVTSPDSVVHWETPESIFGVFFVRDTRSKAIEELFVQSAFSHLVRVEAELDKPTIPAYFDFAGAWSRVEGRGCSPVYPIAIPHRGSEAASRAPHLLEDVRRIVLAPFVPPGVESREVSLARRFGQSERFKERLGRLVERRYFLDPSLLPGYLNWNPSAVVFLSGTLRTGARPELLFRLLFATCGVTPFIYVANSQSVLIVCLSPFPLAPHSERVRRPSITNALERYLQEIVVFRETVGGLRTVTNHRYDKLFRSVNSPDITEEGSPSGSTTYGISPDV